MLQRLGLSFKTYSYIFRRFLGLLQHLSFVFQHLSSDDTTTLGTHTTPEKFYVDDLTFVFNDRIGGGCVIEVNNATITTMTNNMWKCHRATASPSP